MPYTKRIICLANSYKPPQGRCIAGIEVLGNGNYGEWIRPVSARPTAEVSYAEYRYLNGGMPQLLDVIDVPLLNAAPHNHQSENHVIDATAGWAKVGELPWEDVEKLQERPESVWINSDHTQTGVYDCMSQGEAGTLESSLLLVKPENFMVEVGTNPWTGKKTYRGNFDYRGTHHSLSLTDPVARNVFSAKDEGEYPLADVYLCLSVTEPYQGDGRCHKLVAAIVGNPPL